jgi:hypothetical protein
MPLKITSTYFLSRASHHSYTAEVQTSEVDATLNQSPWVHETLYIDRYRKDKNFKVTLERI